MFIGAVSKHLINETNSDLNLKSKAFFKDGEMIFYFYYLLLGREKGSKPNLKEWLLLIAYSSKGWHESNLLRREWWDYAIKLSFNVFSWERIYQENQFIKALTTKYLVNFNGKAAVCVANLPVKMPRKSKLRLSHSSYINQELHLCAIKFLSIICAFCTNEAKLGNLLYFPHIYFTYNM